MGADSPPPNLSHEEVWVQCWDKREGLEFANSKGLDQERKTVEVDGRPSERRQVGKRIRRNPQTPASPLSFLDAGMPGRADSMLTSPLLHSNLFWVRDLQA